MHPLLLILIGAMCGWASQRKNADDLQKWRPMAGAIAALLPFLVEQLLHFIQCDTCYAPVYDMGWSIFFAPVWAMLIAAIFGGITDRDGKVFYLSTQLAVGVAYLFSLLSHEGIQLFAPVYSGRLTLNVLFDFDLTVCGLGLLAVILCFLLPWKRDVARVGLILMIIYAIVVSTFREMGQDFAEKYAETLGLETVRVDALPQPISPMNWRLILETSDHKLHDTMVNLSRQDEWEVEDGARRSERIHSLYKPLNKAVWRVYRRFGNVNPHGIEKLWNSLQKNRPFLWYARYAVYRDLVEYDEAGCVRFQDLRSIGARNKKAGFVLVCTGAEASETYIYKSENSGDLVRVY